MEIIKIVVELAKVLYEAMHWFAEGGAKRKMLAVAVGAVIVLGFGAFIASADQRATAWRTVRPWVVALASSEAISLSDEQAKIVDHRTLQLTQRLMKEFTDHFDLQKQVDNKASRYTAWTLAQVATSLLATSRGAPLVQSHAAEVSAYLRDSKRQIAACDCWSEYVGDPPAPQHIAITAWILYTLERIGQHPTAGEIQFLQETQDGVGSWNMFNVPFGITSDPGLQRPLGSSFATSWCMLALNEMSNKEAGVGGNVRDELAARSRHAVDYFLRDHSNRDKTLHLWSLYPGWQGKPAASTGASGQVLFALHRVVSDLSAVDAEQYARELQEVDRTFLAALPTSPDNFPPLTDGDNYGYLLAYAPITSHVPQTAAMAASAPAGNAVDSVTSFKLPWLIIGAQATYKSGGYLDRVRALRFIDLALTRMDDEVDAALVQQYWMAPEILMSLRYLHDTSSL